MPTCPVERGEVLQRYTRIFHQLRENASDQCHARTHTLVRMRGSVCCHTLTRWFRGEQPKEARELNDTHSLSASATVHLYCAVEKRQMSANCLTDTLIFFTVLLLLFAMCTFTAMFSPWWYSSLSNDASRWSLFGDITNSLLTSTEGCSPCFDGAYMIFRIASRTEFLQHGDLSVARQPDKRTVNPRRDIPRIESRSCVIRTTRSGKDRFDATLISVQPFSIIQISWIRPFIVGNIANLTFASRSFDLARPRKKLKISRIFWISKLLYAWKGLKERSAWTASCSVKNRS